jgi:hypothetical protein
VASNSEIATEAFHGAKISILKDPNLCEEIEAKARTAYKHYIHL